MIFIATGVSFMIYSVFGTMTVLLVAAYRLKENLVFKFSFKKPMAMAVIGAMLVCYGVTTL